MPAAHRAVDHPLIRRKDIPYLIAYASGAILVALGTWGASAILGIPLLRCSLIAVMCYLSILVGRLMKRALLGFLTVTEDEGRAEAEETIHAETTVDMHWNRDTVPIVRPPAAAPVWPADDPEISDRGADERDPLAEHPRSAHPDLRRVARRAGSAPA